MSDDLVARALERLRRATALDGAGDSAAAVDEYDAGVVLLARAMAAERDPALRDTLAAKCGEYADRADLLRAALPAPHTAAEREQADLEARLAALRRSPPCGGDTSPLPHGSRSSSTGDTGDDYSVLPAPRTADEEADEIVRRALAEVRAEEAAAGSKGRKEEGEEDGDGWDALEAQAARECEEQDAEDDAAVRAMIAASRAELERAMRAEDPAFRWDDYDLPAGAAGDAEAEPARCEHVLGGAQRRLDALKRYIARHQPTHRH